jgi:ribonucleoside-diphosphate reductase alpha chain
MYATPLLTNGGTERGLPISCYLNYVPDSREGILGHYDENGWIASMGGGIGGFWGDVRSKGKRTRHKSRTSGVIPFVGVVDREIIAFSQGDTRRGSYNASLDISHPEIREFLNIRKPGNGDLHRKCLNLHHCVNIPDSFMEIIDRCMYDSNASDDWPLIDPHDGQVTEVVSAKELWEIIIKNRLATGEPYIHFIDSSNRALPPTMKAKGLKVRQANLCVEITLPTDE